MAYQINKTDGTIIATVPDGQVDTISTDITLIGKNFSGYGDFLNENFIHLLENFADSKRPTNPIPGQLWFDTIETSLKIYNGKSFTPVSSTAISDRQPTGLRVGDLWFDNINKQLNFYNGDGLVLVSPSYNVSQGKSGLVVSSVLDTLNQSRTITLLYNGGVLLGIFSSSAFNPKIPIAGYTGDIKAGFNEGTVPIKFNVTCSNAEKLDDLPASAFIQNTGDVQINGQLYVASNFGLMIGNALTGIYSTLKFNDGELVLSNHTAGQNLQLSVFRGIDQEPAMNVYTNERRVAFYEEYIDSKVEIGGDVIVKGRLTVAGDITTISSSELVITDKNITLARLTDEEGNVLPATDANADGGGITVEGNTDHSLTWNVDPVPNWTSSDNFNLVAGKHYSINNFPLIQQIDPLNANAGFKLTDHIKEIDGISIFGKREQLIIGPSPVEDPAWLVIENSRITTYDGHNLELAPDGDVVLVGSPKITGLANPVDVQDAATKNYVDEQNKAQTIFLSTTLSSINELIEADYYNLLNTMIPVESIRIGTLVKLLCTIVTNNSLTVNPSVNTSTENFVVSDGFGNPSGSSAPAVITVGVDTINIPAQSMTVSRIIKTFRYEGSGWNLLSDVNWQPA